MNENNEQLYVLCEDSLVELMKRCVSDGDNEQCRVFLSGIVIAGCRLMAKTLVDSSTLHSCNIQHIDAEIAKTLRQNCLSEGKDSRGYLINHWLRLAADIGDTVSLQVLGDALCRSLDKGLETAIFREGLKILDSAEDINRAPYVAKAHDLIKGHVKSLMAAAMNPNEEINLLYEQYVGCSGIWHDALARVFVEVGILQLHAWHLKNFGWGQEFACRLLDVSHEQDMQDNRYVSAIDLSGVNYLGDIARISISTDTIGETLFASVVSAYEEGYPSEWIDFDECRDIFEKCFRLGHEKICEHFFCWIADICRMHSDGTELAKQALLCFQETSSLDENQKDNVVLSFAENLWKITSTSGFDDYYYRALMCLEEISVEDTLLDRLSLAIEFTLNKLDQLCAEYPEEAELVCYDHDILFPTLENLAHKYPYVNYWMAKQHERHGAEELFLELMKEAADQNCTEAAKALVEYYEKQALKYKRTE